MKTHPTAPGPLTPSRSTLTPTSAVRARAGAEPRLGVDIGRVIIHGDGPDTSFIGGTDADAMRAPAMDGALSSLARLCRLFHAKVWLVSKCGPRIEQRSRAWLDRHAFWAETGVPRENLRFCRSRKDKAPICDELGIGFFVDDRLDVLLAMEGVVPHRFLFGASSSPDPAIVPVPTWSLAEEALTALVTAAADTTAGRAR